MYALLPAAGFGTRFLPWSKAIPKELLPLGEVPVIHHVVAEAVDAGLRDIVIVISRGKEAICRYFDRDPELEAYLEAKGKSALLDDLRRLQNAATFHYVYQPEMRGLGDAVLCGASARPGEPFAVLLADTIIRGESPLPAMIRDYEAHGHSSVAVQPVPAARATSYGVCGGHESVSDTFHLDLMVEKPAPGRIPLMRRLDGSDVHMAFAARYVFSPDIVPVLRETLPGKNGEIQLTDAMNRLLQLQGFHAQLLRGKRQDIGTPAGLAEFWAAPIT